MGRWYGLSLTSYHRDDISVLETLATSHLGGRVIASPPELPIASDRRNARVSLRPADHRRINARLVWAGSGTTQRVKATIDKLPQEQRVEERTS